MRPAKRFAPVLQRPDSSILMIARFFRLAGILATALAGGLFFAPLPAQAQSDCEVAPLDRSIIKLRKKTDRFFPVALEDGKAIVIMAGPGLAQRYPDCDAMLDELADDVTDSGTSAAIANSMAVEWVNVDDPSKLIMVGNQIFFSDFGAAGALFAFSGSGAYDYAIYVLDPGVYRLSSISYPFPRTELSTGHGTEVASAGAPIGEARIVGTNRNEMKVEQVWSNGSSRTVGASEQCLWWYKGGCTQSVYTPEHKVLDRAPGYYPMRVPTPVPALDVSLRIDAPVASFEVAAGEIVMVDGIFTDPIDGEIGVSQCRKGSSMHVCSLQSLGIERTMAPIEDLRAHDLAKDGFPQLGKLVRNIRYRPLTISAAEAGKGKFGPRLRVAAGQ